MANPITKIKAVKDFVEDILKNYPQARESDNYLSAVVWHKQVRATTQGDVTFENFLTMYSNSLLASSDQSKMPKKCSNSSYSEVRYDTGLSNSATSRSQCCCILFDNVFK